MVTLESKKRKTIKLAKESIKTKRAREKLQRKLQSIEKRFTTEALQQKRIEIHNWIARHASHRIVLKDKNISLFDENQHTAQSSQKIKEILERVQKNVFFYKN